MWVLLVRLSDAQTGQKHRGGPICHEVSVKQPQNHDGCLQDQDLGRSHCELWLNVVVRSCVIVREGEDIWKRMWEGGTLR